MRNLEASFPATVLVVDDEQVVVDLLSKVLQRAGMPFVAVGTGEEALSLLQRERFGALVSDKNLPDLSGVEVLRAARRLQPYCACLMITGYASTDSVLEVLRMGAADYIEKPFPDLKLLVQRIQTAMAHSRAEFERSTLVEAVRTMQRELAEKSSQAFRHRTEREMLESVLELRIEDSVRELSRRIDSLESELTADRELDRVLVQQLDGLLQYVRGLNLEEEESAVRGVLREIERRIEEPLTLLHDRLDPAEAEVEPDRDEVA